MKPVLPRRRSRKQWPIRERAVLALGLILLAVCALAARWLLGSAQTPPPHGSTAREIFAAIFLVLSWLAGWTLLATGGDLVVPGPASKRKSR